MKLRASQFPPVAGMTTPSLVPGALATHTLESLLQRFGRAERAQVLAYVARTPITTLVEDGSRVSTERVVGEGARILGLASDVLARADADQRALMPALDESMLRAGATALHECDAAGTSRVEDTSKGTSHGRQQRGSRATLAGKVATARKVVYTAAVSLSGGDPDARKRLDDAWGAGDDPRHLATSLDALVVCTRALVADARARAVSVSLQDAWLDEQAGLSAKLLRTVQRADATAAESGVGQGEVAWWRGIVLWFLKQVIDTLDVVRESDPRVRKIPLGDLRHVLRRSGTSARKTPVQPPAPPAPPV